MKPQQLTDTTPTMMKPSESDERIQKYLARHGVASRRAVEKLIKAGRISVNGQIAGLGQKVGAEDEISVDGRPIKPDRAELKLLILHKPVGYLCSSIAEHGLPSVFELLPDLQHGRWVMVGRLDVNTSGLLLFTTDGQLAQRLAHPRYAVEREYLVRVRGRDINQAAARISVGVELEDGQVVVKSVKPIKTEGGNYWYKMVLTEGKNRIVRRLWEQVGCHVNRLIRIRFADIGLPKSLKPGQYQLFADQITKKLVNDL